MSADNVLSTTTTSTALGTVIMATQYNSLNANFVDKRTMENYEFANSAKPSVTFLHPIECKSSLDVASHLYVRTSSQFTGDQRLYDLGDFQLAVQGMAFNGGVIGELWATYEVEFFKPKITLGAGCQSCFFDLTGVTNSIPLGTSNTIESNINSIPLAISASGLVLSFPINTTGKFIAQYYVTGTAVSVTTPPSVSYTNCTGINMWNGDTTNYVVGPAGSSAFASTTLVLNFAINVVPQGTGSASYVSFGTGGSLPSTPTAAGLFICRFD